MHTHNDFICLVETERILSFSFSQSLVRVILKFKDFYARHDVYNRLRATIISSYGEKALLCFDAKANTHINFYGIKTNMKPYQVN